MAFRSPLIDEDLGITTARVGVARVGIARVGFAPKDTDELSIKVGDEAYYAHRETPLTPNGHTEIP
jgi:hypothetical protein